MNGTCKISGTPWKEGEHIQTKGTDNLFNRIIAEIFTKFKRDLQVQEVYRTLNCWDQKWNIPRHIITKHWAHRTKNSESCKRKKKQVRYKGKGIRITADFSTQILTARRSWKDLIQGLKERNCLPTLVYPAQLSFLIKLKSSTARKN
jgi:hypothetical protein